MRFTAMANPPSSTAFDWKMFRYVPSLAAAIAALIVFLFMAILHLYQFVKQRNRIVIFVVIGAFCKFSAPTIPIPFRH